MTGNASWMPRPDDRLRDAYLRRLGWTRVPRPGVETLFALHRAQVERVPYESVWIWLGESRTIDAADSVRYVTGPGGHGGYCYHMNGSLSALLVWLGFEVHWHVGGVQTGPDDPVGATANHLVLEVAGLPTDANPSGRWLVDAGLGDGLHDPLPLIPGEYQQGPFRYRLAPSDAIPGGWRFDADPRMSLLRMDFAPHEAAPADFTAKHRFLSTSPESGFVRVATVFRRDPTGFDMLRGCVLKRIDTTGEHTTELTTPTDWFAALADIFGLTLSDVDAGRRAALWRKIHTAHEGWKARAANTAP